MHTIVSATSGINIFVDDYGVHFDTPFEYKDLTRWDLTWRPEDKTLIIWEPEDKAGTTHFEGTQQEYDEWVQPIVDIFNAKVAEEEQEKEEQLKDEVLQANLALERYDANIKVYQDRIGIALANGDTELVTELQNEMNSLDPALATQDTSDIRHYCKKCGHNLDAYNVCTNPNCKRKQQQDLITQLIEEREAEEQTATENQESNTQE